MGTSESVRVAGPLGTDDVLRLQRAAGNQAVSQLMLQRDDLKAPTTPSADRFKGSAKLEACFQDRARLRQGDPDVDATQRVQEALLELPAKTGNAYDLGTTGADGNYGKKTAAAIRKFKTDENLGSTQFGDVGPGTMRRLDALFTGNKPGPGPEPKPPRPKKEENEIFAALFHNRELEKLFDKIVLQYGKMLRQQGAALTQVQTDLSTTEKAEPTIAQRVLLFAAEKVIDGTLGGGDTSLRKAVSAAIASVQGIAKDGLDKAVEGSFDAAVKGGKDVIKENIAPGGQETQPLAKFIDAQHNALIESNNSAVEDFTERKNGKGGADEGLRTFTDEDKAQILASFPAVADPRLDRAQKYLDGLVAATGRAKDTEYTHAVREWSVGNAQQGTDDNFNPGGVPVTDANQLRGKGKNDVPGVFEIEIDFDRNNAQQPVTVTGLSVSGLSPAARGQVTKLQGDKPMGELGYVERVTGSRGDVVGIGGTQIAEAKNETGQLFSVGTNDAGGDYLSRKANGVFVFGQRRLFEEVDAVSINKAGGLKGP
jgi:peptidoglycan hydrolase-like protein with peptidoglycan-binding domain